ncbi:hypothetical protein M436DRAFT_86093 [Aureobasidium namibiae CBS 147.97]|uniref:EamA domain-containing protein n=1 Tax=Aureobasidium namibiae CBS 147.97 TaxID=1043004 RepID=A0A074WFS5_9PEZI
MSTPTPKWLLFAIASGACAALNGVFAKLTTTHLTTAWAESLSHVFGLSGSSKFFEFLVRGLFFVLNLVFNGIMWGLFTRALTLASSTTRVSVINTSANFMITAVLGVLIFSETLPGLWLLGAAMLVAGSVIIGRREEGKETGDAGTAGAEPTVLATNNSETTPFADEPDAPLEGRDNDQAFKDAPSTHELENTDRVWSS